MTGAALIVQGDALRLPLPDASVDLVVTSPPYWALRAYSAGPGEIGSEPTPAEYLEALWAATVEMMRVLKPTGSMFVDLGDKYNAYNGNRGDGQIQKNDRRPLVDGGNGLDAKGMPPKSLMLLPERYRVGCVDRLGLIARAVLVWDKPNGLPESVTDRVRRSHEDWVHLVKQPRYYSATDEVREPQANFIAQAPGPRRKDAPDSFEDAGFAHKRGGFNDYREQNGIAYNPLGKLPGSVWSIPSEPLRLPGYFITQDGTLVDFLAPTRGPGRRPRTNGHAPGLFDADAYAELMAGEDAGAWRWVRATGINASPWPKTDAGLQLHTAASHYAAFPSRWPERLIKGFSPPGICLECGQGRVPVVEREKVPPKPRSGGGQRGHQGFHAQGDMEGMKDRSSYPGFDWAATILGYACSCTPFTDHPGTGEPSGPDKRYGDYLPDGGYPQQEENSNGRGATSLQNRPKVGPWREYHIEGWKPPPTRPAVVLDPFGGTGTVAMVARALDRIGISVDLSRPYSRAARWRVRHNAGKAISRTNLERQGQLL